MNPGGAPTIRRAMDADADAVARLLDAFNREFDEPSPGTQVLAERVRTLLAQEQMVALLVGPGPNGVAVLRFRPALWTPGLDCYLEELYVEPQNRGQGLGRALMGAAIERARRAGADEIHLGTSEADVAARALYESLGFSNNDGVAEGPVNYFYELEL